MAGLRTHDQKKDIILMLAILCHDLGKAVSTQVIDDKVDAKEHHNILEPTLSLLERLTDQKSLIDAIIPLVQEHPMPSRLYKENAHDSEIRRLSTRVNIEDLVTLAKADNFGRTTQDALDKIYPAGEWLITKAKELNVLNKGPKQILQGRHLIANGLKAGKTFKDILEQAYQAQLEGAFFTEEEALVWLEDYLSLLS
jgi:tRNA nucleotidyltransferase (CCA-adding enzyme)